jgi:hypothetical protein
MSGLAILPLARFSQAAPDQHVCKQSQEGETFRHTVVALIREHYPDCAPTIAMARVRERHGLRVGVETLRQWMMADGLYAPKPPGSSRDYGQGNRSAMKRRKATLATSSLRETSARTQPANSLMVSLRLGGGLGMQTFVPLGFWRSVCSTP